MDKLRCSILRRHTTFVMDALYVAPRRPKRATGPVTRRLRCPRRLLDNSCKEEELASHQRNRKCIRLCEYGRSGGSYISRTWRNKEHNLPEHLSWI